MNKFKKLIIFCFVFASGILSTFAGVLIVADEHPAMRYVADKLKNEEHIDSKVIWQTNLPPSLKEYQAVIMYIHKALSIKAENAFIDYTKNGGRLVVLHHSISSGKRTNENWFNFLGVSLPLGDVNQGGYKWTEGVNWELVNLNPKHFIMTNKIQYPDQIEYESTIPPAKSGKFPGFKLHESEVYVNHMHTEPRPLLMGLKYTDPSGKTWMQDRAGWIRPSGKGLIVYLMPGHTIHDFENPAYGRMVVNAVIYKP